MRPIDADALFPNGVFYVNASNPNASLNELLNRIQNAPTIEVELTRREKEVLNTNLSAEIMKLQFHYNCNEGDFGVPERLRTLYSLRDKLCCGTMPLAPEEEKVLEMIFPFTLFCFYN